MAEVISIIGSGAGADYTTLTLWYSAQGNPTGGTVTVAEMQDQAHTSGFPSGARTTDASNYFVIRPVAGAEFDPVTKSGALIALDGGGTAVIAMQPRPAYTQIRNLGITVTNTSAADSYGIYISSTAGVGITIHSVTCYSFSGRILGNFHRTATTNSEATVYNCLAFDFGTAATGGYSSGFRYLICYNCTEHGGNNGGGTKAQNGFVGSKTFNCIAVSNYTKDFDTPHADSDYCISEDATGPGANSSTGVTIADCFIDADGDDFHIKAGSPLADAGYDYGLVQSMDGPVPTGWPRNDIGCFEFLYCTPSRRKAMRVQYPRPVGRAWRGRLVRAVQSADNRPPVRRRWIKDRQMIAPAAVW